MMGQLVLSQEQLKDISARLGREISLALEGEKKVPLLLGVLKGSLNFMFDLLPNISIPVYTDYIQISSYVGDRRGDEIRLLKDLSMSIKDRTVIIIEDIVDTGYSMRYLLDHLSSKGAKKVMVCALFDKKNAREIEVPLDFVGHTLEKNDFLIGYGLDYNELERNLPYVYSATKEDVARLDAILKKDGE